MKLLLFFITMGVAWQLDAMYMVDVIAPEEAVQPQVVYTQEDFFNCILKGSCEDMERIIKNNRAHVHEPDAAGDTPLMYAILAKADKLEKVKLLVKYGAWFDEKNNLDQTAQDWAKAYGYADLVSYFEERCVIANAVAARNKRYEEEKR